MLTNNLVHWHCFGLMAMRDGYDNYLAVILRVVIADMVL